MRTAIALPNVLAAVTGVRLDGDTLCINAGASAVGIRDALERLAASGHIELTRSWRGEAVVASLSTIGLTDAVD